MNDTEIYHLLKGTKQMPKCLDLFALLGAVKGNEYSCPHCDTVHNDTSETYVVNKDKYPKCFNEHRGSTIDGCYWDWDEVHCCENCQTKYWFTNGS